MTATKPTTPDSDGNSSAAVAAPNPPERATPPASHTAGPWRAMGAGISTSTDSTTLSSGRRVDFRVAVCKDGDISTVRANARLIAASPELLAALKDALAEIHNPGAFANRTGKDITDVIAAAIAAATEE